MRSHEPEHDSLSSLGGTCYGIVKLSWVADENTLAEMLQPTHFGQAGKPGRNKKHI